LKADKKDVLTRLASIEGHLGGIRKMIEDDTYCVDVLKQTYAVQRGLDRLQALILSGHLASCVPERIVGDEREQVMAELVELYELARK